MQRNWKYISEDYNRQNDEHFVPHDICQISILVAEYCPCGRDMFNSAATHYYETNNTFMCHLQKGVVNKFSIVEQRNEGRSLKDSKKTSSSERKG